MAGPPTRTLPGKGQDTRPRCARATERGFREHKASQGPASTRRASEAYTQPSATCIRAHVYVCVYARTYACMCAHAHTCVFANHYATLRRIM